MQHRLAHRVGRSSQATTAAVDKPMSASHTEFLTTPPTVLHITDGESTDGNPEQLADSLRQFQTTDGNILLLNLHVSALAATPISFPASDAGLPDQYAKLLFRMSSPLPSHLIKVAQEKGRTVSNESRGYVFNADAAEIVDFFDIGTRPAQLR